MPFPILRGYLLWCTVVNSAILLLWFATFALAGDFIYRLHSRWIPISRESFNSLHYAGMMFFKLAILFFNLVPLIVILITGARISL